jgi:hypothetical protein
MPTDLYPRAQTRREDSTSFAEGFVIALWSLAMIVLTLVSGVTPPAG